MNIIRRRQAGARQAEKTACRLRRREVARAPLFPGHLFVEPDLDCELDLDSKPWRSINGTVGVVRLGAFGDRPAAVPAVAFTLVPAGREPGIALSRRLYRRQFIINSY